MKIVATIQVRMGSSRFQGKVLKKVLGKPLLGYLVDRVQKAKEIDDIIVATSIKKENDAIADFCKENGINCFRGSEDDVLGRMLGSLQLLNADAGVEIYGDCPLIDPKIIDDIVKRYRQESDTLDFISNDLETTYPPGMEVEVFSVSALIKAYHQKSDPSIREHGTLYIRQNPDKFNILNIRAPKKFFYPDLEIEVDTAEDFKVISSIICELYPENRNFSLEGIIAYMLNNPDIAEINSSVPRRWKEFRNE